jgi:pyruvate/2-oxoglutarate dehydrogenase complex dihydrolipoamide acyltransferase (E2) component
VGTLQLTPQIDGGLLATVERGMGATLGEQSTLDNTDQKLSGRDSALAELAGNLASRSGRDSSADLAKFGIRFIVLQPGGTTVESADTAVRTETALDGNAALAAVGDTEFGRLWQFGQTDAAASTPRPAHAGGVFRLVTLLIAIAVIGSAVLLSLPIGAGREAVREANRDAIRKAARANAKQKQKLKPKTTSRRSRRALDRALAADLGTQLEPPVGTDLEADLAIDRETGVGTGLESDDGFEPTGDEAAAETAEEQADDQAADQARNQANNQPDDLTEKKPGDLVNDQARDQTNSQPSELANGRISDLTNHETDGQADERPGEYQPKRPPEEDNNAR